MEDIRRIVQDYFAHYTNPINTFDDDTNAANVFCGAITYASFVYGNRLLLGGHYMTNQKDKVEILNHLKEITKILDKYMLNE